MIRKTIKLALLSFVYLTVNFTIASAENIFDEEQFPSFGSTEHVQAMANAVLELKEIEGYTAKASLIPHTSFFSGGNVGRAINQNTIGRAARAMRDLSISTHGVTYFAIGDEEPASDCTAVASRKPQFPNRIYFKTEPCEDAYQIDQDFWINGYFEIDEDGSVGFF